MRKWRQVIETWRIVYKKPSYVLSAFGIAFVFYLLNVLINNHSYRSLFDVYQNSGLSESLKFFFFLSVGFKDTVYLITFINIIVTGILIGMFLTLVTYKSKALRGNPNLKKKKTGIFGGLGAFLSMAAPGCAACGVGLLALFGISATALALLPFEGVEVSLIALGILAISVWQISKGLLKCDSCQIQLNKDAHA